jgi:RHS repeat-associated protein
LFKTADKLDRRYGAGGCLNEADGTRYVHDADGQLVEEVLPDGQRRRYRWNGRGELVEVTRPDGKRVAFAYDAFGRRIRKDFDGRSTRYVWDGDDPVHELADGSPLVTWEFEQGTFGLLAKIEGERRYSAVTDHLGTPKALFDAQGEMAWKAELDLYGMANVQIAKTACPWRWPGQYEDEETGLYYNRFRYYDPEAGRYISPDPLGLRGGIALYTHVPDPLIWIDPLGLSKRGPCTAGGRSSAFRAAKRDLGIPVAQHPLEVGHVNMRDRNGRQILNADGRPITTREYVFEMPNQQRIIIQDHTAGHAFGDGGVGDQGPHFNVRPIKDPRNGHVPGTLEHYPFDL